MLLFFCLFLSSICHCCLAFCVPLLCIYAIVCGDWYIYIQLFASYLLFVVFYQWNFLERRILYDPKIEKTKVLDYFCFK